MALREEFYVSVHGEQKGPFTFQQLVQLRDKGFIAEETLYWRDGMEQWTPIEELCGPSKKKRRLRGQRRWVAAGVVGALLLAAAVVLGPALFDAWREINQHEYTANSAWWKARGFVRQELHRRHLTASFENEAAATVTLKPPTGATVDLADTFDDGKGGRIRCSVRLRFDPTEREWRLESLKAEPP